MVPSDGGPFIRRGERGRAGRHCFAAPAGGVHVCGKWSHVCLVCCCFDCLGTQEEGLQSKAVASGDCLGTARTAGTGTDCFGIRQGLQDYNRGLLQDQCHKRLQETATVCEKQLHKGLSGVWMCFNGVIPCQPLDLACSSRS